jgi:hypothetical protein
MRTNLHRYDDELGELTAAITAVPTITGPCKCGCCEAYAPARGLAAAIVLRREKEAWERDALDEKQAQENEARQRARLARKAAYDTWHPVLAPLFRNAGRHLSSGRQWQHAMQRAGLNTNGADFGGSHTAMIVEELVLHAVGIRDVPSGMSATKAPRDPDMAAVQHMCERIAASKNNKGQTLQEWADTRNKTRRAL